MKNVYVLKLKGNLEAVKKYSRACARKQFPNCSYKFIARPVAKDAYNVFLEIIDNTASAKQIMTKACALVKSGKILLNKDGSPRVERRGNVYMVNNHRVTKALAKAEIKAFAIEQVKGA